MESRFLTILLTDLAGFTSLTQSLSRERVMDLVEFHAQLVKPVVERRHGRIIKEMGDAFLTVFESPTNALLAADGIRSAARNLDPKIGLPPLRIAVTAGDIVELKGDIHGDAVNLAARIESVTPANRIWTDSAVAAGVKTAEVNLLKLGTCLCKGFADPIHIFEAFPPERRGYYIVGRVGREGPFPAEHVRALAARSEVMVLDEAIGKLVSSAEHPHFANLDGGAPAPETRPALAKTPAPPPDAKVPAAGRAEVPITEAPAAPKKKILVAVGLAILLLIAGGGYGLYRYFADGGNTVTGTAMTVTGSPAEVRGTPVAVVGNEDGENIPEAYTTGSWTRYVLDNIEILNIPKSQFCREQKIDIHQGITYIKDDQGVTIGLVITQKADFLNKQIANGTFFGIGLTYGPARDRLTHSPPEGYVVYVAETGGAGTDASVRLRGNLIALYEYMGTRKVRTTWTLSGNN